MVLSRNRFGDVFFVLILTYIIFFPTYFFGSVASTGQQVLYITVPLFFVLATSVSFLLGAKVFYGRSLFLFFFFVFLVYFSSIVSKLGYLNYFYVFAHIRYLAYFVLFMSAYYFSRFFHISFPDLRIIIYSVSFFVLAFIFLQFLIPHNGLIGYISNRDLFHSYLGIQIGGPFVWSYSLMFFLVLPLAMVFASIIFFKNKRVLSFLLGFIFIFLFLASQSKSAYIAIFFIFSFYFVMYLKYASFSMRLLSSLFFVGFLGFLIFFISSNLESLGNIYRFVISIQEGGLDASTRTRLSQMSGIYESMLINPFFGSPSNYLVIENAYGYYLYFFGLVGLALYLFFVATFVFMNYRYLLLFLDKDRFNADIVSAVFILSCSVFIFSLSNPPLDSAKTSAFFWVIMGMYYGVIRNYFVDRGLVMSKDCK